MPNSTTLITDGIIITGLLLRINAITGLGYEAILAQEFPALDAGKAQALANEAQIAQERRDTAALPDDAPTGELP